MQYRKGNIGRVFIVKVEHGDDLLESIKEIAQKENIEAATLFMLGAMKEASLVVGPKEAVLPPDPSWTEFQDGREIVGIGTLFKDGTDPALHIHIGVGRGEETLIGCIRKNGEVYIVVELIIMEITGIEVEKVPDEKMGLKMLKFLK
ncbi:MAG: DUF296 domain-containing protein [Clostridia bacterium]|nr:DUF296 domain-containing protein [Clostridia bacterium]